MENLKNNFFKLTLLVLFIPQINFAQRPKTPAYQPGNVTQLILFESSLPKKKYDYATSDLQVNWHVILLDLFEQTPGYTPNVAARTLAYLNLAAYESILPAFPDKKSMSDQISDYKRLREFAMDSTDFIPQLAMNQAIYHMVNEYFQMAPYVYMEHVIAFRDSIDILYSTNRSSFSILKSKNYGRSIAEYIARYARKDGAKDSQYRSYDIQYRLPECPSCFEINRVADLENTGPLHPHWGRNRTFMKSNARDFGLKPDFEFSIYKNSLFYKDAYEVYQTSKEVKPGSEKHLIANFWDDAATYTYTAIGHSASILTQKLYAEPRSFYEGAKVYLALSLGLNDAMIGAWREKYKHNLIRPIAYVKRYIDSSWEPVLLTPPFPEFPSGHSAQSATMATILSSFFGDEVAFTDYSKYWVGRQRRFKSFWEAAHETSISRMYGGIHYREALEKGEELGKVVGENILKLKFE